MNSFTPAYVWLSSRLLMAAMFVESFIDKLMHWSIYAEETAVKGIPMPTLALGLAVATEVFGSVTLITGAWIRIGVFMLGGYVLVLDFFYFNFWSLEGKAAVIARKEFLKDFAVIAGLLLFLINGADKHTRNHNQRRS